MNTDTRIHPNEVPPAMHNGRVMVDGYAGENPLDVFAARFGVTKTRAEEMFQFFDEHWNSGDMINNGSLADALRKRDVQWFIWLGKILAEIDTYTYKQRAIGYMRMTIKVVQYILGFKEDAGAHSISEIAQNVKFGDISKSQSGKQTAHKCAEHFLKQFKLAPMFSQRTEAARAEMSRARNEQLTTQNHE